MASKAAYQGEKGPSTSSRMAPSTQVKRPTEVTNQLDARPVIDSLQDRVDDLAVDIR